MTALLARENRFGARLRSRGDAARRRRPERRSKRPRRPSESEIGALVGRRFLSGFSRSPSQRQVAGAGVDLKTNMKLILVALALAAAPAVAFAPHTDPDLVTCYEFTLSS